MGEVYRGVDGVREYFRGFFGAMDETGADVEEWIDGGDDVIAVMHTWGRGRKSGAPVEAHQFHVWTVRDGKLARLRVYTHRAEAPRAVGLES
jgi:ketosteroid isomerase-like protein